MTAETERFLLELAPIVERLVAREVARAVAAIPPARDGRDGLPGPAGLPGHDGAPGAAGKDGADGRDGTLEAVTFIRTGRTITVRRADGTPIGSWVNDGEVLYCGVYRTGTTYLAGDAVTYAGSLWIAGAATSVRPSEGTPDWALAVKRGDPGKVGPAGPVGPTGEKGAQGVPGVRY